MSDHDEQSEPQGPTVRDRRRIDPETFEVREPQSAAAPGPEAPAGAATSPGPDGPAGEDEQVQQLQTALAERTADLQRLQAEYVNYKRRVDRDRDLTRKVALEGFVKDLLPVLDDVRSAREHGELTGAFKAVGEQVERITAKHGLESFGTKGDPFDPHVHDALMQVPAEGVDGPTCVEILQPGYRIGDRVLRPARVAVGEPVEGSAAPSADDAGAPAADAEQ
ncbi:nucleotide exchange factor GrpE [Microlunatus capsulatus]|uniref:Protein GrpE n=1 Tax=Microlunatus capsulatus TaxID=99117 RepID=A0ABS4Z7G7_9ACTN|nr:nucleotide exchange factor GrpE [Microlunatus capsulatus]MBP2417001.1 molecular chaperone GrpE [Microlunatus capsulatus]